MGAGRIAPRLLGLGGYMGVCGPSGDDICGRVGEFSSRGAGRGAGHGRLDGGLRLDIPGTAGRFSSGGAGSRNFFSSIDFAFFPKTREPFLAGCVLEGSGGLIDRAWYIRAGRSLAVSRTIIVYLKLVAWPSPWGYARWGDQIFILVILSNRADVQGVVPWQS